MAAAGRLAAITPISSRRRPLSEAERLQAELEAARGQIDQLTATVADQAKTLAAVTDDCPPWAPTIATIYWLYGPPRWHEPSWNRCAQRLRPLISAMGDLPAPKLTPMVWEQHRARRRQEPSPTTGRPVGEPVLNRELERAKQMLEWATVNGLIRFNPLKAAKRVKAISRRDTWINPTAFDRLLSACAQVTNRQRHRRSFGKVIASKRNAPFLTIKWWDVDGSSRQRTGFRTREDALEALKAIRAGRVLPKNDDGWRAAVLRAFILCLHDGMLRFNEARTIRWDQIGPDGRVELAARLTKSRKRRTIFLTSRTLEAIRALPRDPANPYIFAHRPYGEFSPSVRLIGQPICDRRLSYWFRRACEISGVDALVAPGERRLHAHDLRASGASTADELGARPTAIRDALGHSSLAITEIYLRSSQAENAKAVTAKLSKLGGE